LPEAMIVSLIFVPRTRSPGTSPPTEPGAGSARRRARRRIVDQGGGRIDDLAHGLVRSSISLAITSPVPARRSLSSVPLTEIAECGRRSATGGRQVAAAVGDRLGDARAVSSSCRRSPTADARSTSGRSELVLERLVDLARASMVSAASRLR
jgi:hypothetical protein